MIIYMEKKGRGGKQCDEECPDTCPVIWVLPQFVPQGLLGVHATKKPSWQLHGMHVFIQTGTKVVLCS